MIRSIIILTALIDWARAGDPASGGFTDPSAGGSAAGGTTGSSDPSAATTTTTTVTPSTFGAPILGDPSAKLMPVTNSSIMATYGVNDEGTSNSRYYLLRDLAGATSEKMIALEMMQNNTDMVKSDVDQYVKKIDNITVILNADASAGGILASSRALVHDLPDTQKMMSNTLSKGVKNIQNDVFVIQSSIESVQEDYLNQMQALADTTGQLIKDQDKRYAAQMGGQLQGMNMTLTSMKNKQLVRLNDVESTVFAADNQMQKVSNFTKEGTQIAEGAVEDLRTGVDDLKSDFQSALQDASAAVNEEVLKVRDSSIDALEKSAGEATANAETYAMSASSNLARGLSNLDSQSGSLVNGIVKDASTAAMGVANSAENSQITATRGINAATDKLDNDLVKVTSRSDAVTKDSLRIYRDLQGFLQAQSTASSQIGSGNAAELSRLQSLLANMMGKTAQNAQETSGDVVGDSTGETARLAQILGLMAQRASDKASSVSGQSRTDLENKQKQQAEDLARKNSEIESTEADLDDTMNGVGKAALRGAGDVNAKLGGLTTTFGGSIAELFALLSGDSGSTDLDDISGSLGSHASDVFGGILGALKGVNDDTSQDEFEKRTVGPANEAAAKQFQQIKAMIATLLLLGDSQSGDQDSAMDRLSLLKRQFGGTLANLTQSLNGVSGVNAELGNTVGNQGQELLNEYKARMIKALMDEMNGSQSDSSSGLSQIDKLLSAIGGNDSTEESVAQQFARAGAGLDTGSRDFSNAEKDQLKSLSGLSAMAASLLGQTSNQGIQDTADAKGSMENAKANIVAKFKELASNKTDTELGKIMNDLANAGNQTDIINFLMGDVADGLKRIDSDAAVAREINDKKQAEFSNYVSTSQAELQRTQAQMVAQLESTLHDIEVGITNKTKLIVSSEGQMKGNLDEIRSKIEAAQDTLRKNLVLYQDKLDGIINQIRSYMNLSSSADELAISQDIAKQLSKINGTEIVVASANEALIKQIDQKQAGQNKNGQAMSGIVNDVISGAIDTETGASSSHLANTDRLVAIAGNVDESATSLEKQIKDSGASMEETLASSKADAGKVLKESEGSQAKEIGQVNAKSTDVASQSRKSFIRLVEQMGGVDDDTLMVSNQLSALMDKADGSITDVSESVMSHLDLSTATMKNLNRDEVRKVATVSDVMGSFSQVVTGFINETRSAMETIMKQLNTVSDSSRKKLMQIDIRSRDELNWVNSGINKTVDALNQVLDQEGTIQGAMKEGLTKADQDQRSSSISEESKLGDIDDAITSLRQELSRGQSGQLKKVRDWITSRDPNVARDILGSSSSSPSSFIEISPVERRLREIRSKIKQVHRDLEQLAH
jgi:hypothetical protein